jgi:SAM-dependent methyltransferase
MPNEPARLEMLLTRAAFFLFGKSVYKAFADRLPLGGAENVLDFGCGMGTVAYYAAKRLPHGRLTCLDISARWLKACRKTLRGAANADFMLWDLSPLPSERYNVVYCHFVLHDVDDDALESVLRSVAQTLIRGGVLVFREPLTHSEKLAVIRRRLEQHGLLLKCSRVTDIPAMGNALESMYVRQ